MGSDFQSKFPDNSGRFFQEWPSWTEKLLNAAYEKAKADKKKSISMERFKIGFGKYNSRYSLS